MRDKEGQFIMVHLGISRLLRKQERRSGLGIRERCKESYTGRAIEKFVKV